MNNQPKEDLTKALDEMAACRKNLVDNPGNMAAKKKLLDAIVKVNALLDGYVGDRNINTINV